ncbi:MAG: hypothetical protein OHK0024_02740 [Thalassobaculales bacterium]
MYQSSTYLARPVPSRPPGEDGNAAEPAGGTGLAPLEEAAALADAGAPDAALRALAARQPPSNHAAVTLAHAHDRLGDRRTAIQLLRQVVERVPGHSASTPLARLLMQEAAPPLAAGDVATALPLLQEAAQYNCTLPGLLAAIGGCLVEMGEFPAAAEALQAALRLYPDDLAALISLAAALDNLNRHPEAEALCRQLVAGAAAGMPHPWNNLGAALRNQGRFAAARRAFAAALALDPGFVPAHSNLGTLASLLGRFDESRACYRRALRLDPQRRELRFLMACDRLKAGDWAEGWAFYEGRAACRIGWPEIAALPAWPGGNPAGLRILLACEQGYGDSLHFFRYARLLADRGARVGLAPPPALARLFALSDPRLILLPPGAPADPGDWDYGLPLMSLPHRFATRPETVPAVLPYLAFDPAEGSRWADRLAGLAGRRVGIVWAGEPRPEDPRAAGIDSRRSLAAHMLRPLAAVAGVSFVSLQKGAAAAQIGDCGFACEDWTGELADFADTAALTAQLDLVVSADTAVAHLAGGLGRPVMLLSRFDGCWRWMHRRRHTPWYPTMRLFHQRRWRDWSAAVEELAAALAAWAQSPG